MDYFMKLIKRKYSKDISKDPRARQKLRREAARARFEELNNDLFKKTLAPVKKAMEDASFKKKEIEELVLVGGSTRIPKVQQLLKDYFDGKEPNKGVNPDE